ncbi:hypothetical protein JRQ81_004269 [Phrynocephalus forsythii]|uniref:Ribonuclease A-domain domain-containing protein n=1 Tax=Phrynocephalus forsythii TaxID=171643 RepID=A0A9Q0XFW0_9SAUR|nr:hypothetical protein JRQ81_004269 [Phrynocephalus forsythii]
MMRERKMAKAPCKPRNTFILDHNNIPQIQQVCHDQSMRWGKKKPRARTLSYYYNSTRPFDLIDCNSRSGACQYRGTAYHKCIIVGCSNHSGTGDPVHFEVFIMQSSKASCILHIFLATLFVVILLHSYASAATWNDFKKRHIAPGPRNENLNAFCDQMMRARGMTERQCKPLHTFIQASTFHVQQVCRGQSTHWKLNLFDSTRHFDLTNCLLRGGRPPSNCRYQGTAANRRITVACSGSPLKGKPIHLETTKP